MWVYSILQVIYSPIKAFQKIVKNPKYNGPILIMALFIAANVASVYISIPNVYVEQTLPSCSQKDAWTENSTLWTSNASQITESEDHIQGTCYGNNSIEFFISNTPVIRMQLNLPEPVNCTGDGGYNNLSFRIKVASSRINEWENAVLKVHSGDGNYYQYPLAEELTPIQMGVWHNLTVPLGSETSSWERSSDQADWENLTGIEFELKWTQNNNATLRLDGLFFRGTYRSEVENAPSYILNSAISSFMQFTIRWITLGGIIYLLTKAVGDRLVWRRLLIVLGFTLIPLVIQVLVNTALYTTLPKLYYPLEYFTGNSAEFESARAAILEQTQFVSQISSYIQIGISMWIIGLSAIALRSLKEYSWVKGISFSISAYFASLLIERLLLGY
ncbi:MAG: hypothetical protein ACOC6H_03335 [Thermoproteota archaeon]